jgi:hypothetical protein
MITKNKILETMYRLMHKLEDDWTEELERLNIDDDVAPLYSAPGVEGNTLTGNIILCYTVLAYDNGSSFLEPHKDRWENKKKIMVKLAGLSAMTIDLYKKVISNEHTQSFDLATWYLNYQKDWRWSNYITLLEYHSMAETMSKKGALDAQEGIQIGKMLEISEKRRERADTLLEEMQKEFLSLDTACEKEGRPRVTDMDNTNFMSYENYLNNKKNKQEAA